MEIPMARMLCIQIILLSLTSCSSIRLLSKRNEQIKGPTITRKSSPVSLSSIRKKHAIKNTVDLDELEKEIERTEPKQQKKVETIVSVAPEQVETKVLIEAEKEIIKKYDKNDLLKEDPVNSEAVGEAEFDISYKKKHYDFWIKYFTKRDRKRFLRHSKNGTKYKAIVESILEEEGLPKDLFYVGLIESGYNTHIASRAQAVGPWQFIKGTATRYGLRVDSRVDERRNIFKATRAAAHYFKDLYNIFGSWELALCAYNAGEYRIINAIRRGNTRDYKSLVAKKLLPKETIFYIPKVAAAKELWSINKVSTHSDHKLYGKASEIKVYKSFSAKKVRKTLGISKRLFTKLNPDMKKDWVTKRRKGHRIYIPTRLLAGAKKKLASLKATRRVASSRVKNKRAAKRVTKVHKVRRGESLYKIARKYGTTISWLKKRNSLRRNKIFVGQKLKVLKKVAAKKKVYIVKRGDSLYGIARKFGLTVNSIVSANRLKRKTIYPRQKIYLPRLL
jgi:membrane-bound lytic murein transglycosylase D